MSFIKLWRKHKNLGIKGAFAHWYDRNTRAHRIGEMQAYARIARKYITENADVLEVAPGPGYFTIELAKLGNYHLTGMDISADFVDICQVNALRERITAEFIQGNVSYIPFADNYFDFIFCSAAFKNFQEPVRALNEMYRVLKENCTCLIVDMNHDVTSQALNEEAAKISQTGLERWFMKKTFQGLAKGAYTKSELEKMILQTPFNKNEIISEGITFFIYLHK